MGKTPAGRTILMCRITDHNVPDDDKQIALFTSCHAATEKNSTTSLLHVIKYLIGDSPTAAEIRRRQVVLVMPCNDPDGYHRGSKARDVYGCWDWNGVTDPENHPEAVILQRVIEEHQPEVLVDVHGISHAEQMMSESTGISWWGGYCRAYEPQVPHLMNEAADEAGFLMSMGERSEGKVLATGPVPGADEHFYLRCGKVIVNSFSYHRCHTLAMTMETGFEQSAHVRLCRLLEIGNTVWRGERYPGYPVNQLGWWGSTAIAAWGRTAKERRASRIELWRKAAQLCYGGAGPESRGSMVAFFSPDPKAWSRIVPEYKLACVLENLKAEEGYDTEAIGDFIQTIPSDRVKLSGPLAREASSPTIENGVVIRLLIPYPDAELTHLRLDGHLVSEDDLCGYHIGRNPGTIVEVAIPPGKVRPFHVVTCAYTTATERPSGFHRDDWNR